MPGWRAVHALSTCDAIFVIDEVILRLTVLIGSPVISNRLPNQRSRLRSDHTGVVNVDRQRVLYFLLSTIIKWHISCVKISVVNILLCLFCQHSYNDFEKGVSLIQGPSSLAGQSCYFSADFDKGGFESWWSCILGE